MRRIDTDADVAAGLADLLAADPRLVAVAALAGPVPLRRRPPGFEGLARVVVAQQVSAAAATSIWARVERLVGANPGPEVLAAHDDDALRAADLSAAKVRTLRAVAAACTDGLDLAAIAEAPADDAIATLTRITGIGPWTAEVFLLFAAGHPDVWPGGDLALRAAQADALGLAERPSDRESRVMAEAWAPWRSVAARLFWAWWGARRDGRDGMIGA